MDVPEIPGSPKCCWLSSQSLRVGELILGDNRDILEVEEDCPHWALCSLSPEAQKDRLRSLPITLGFALALGRNCSLSHLLIQSECAFLPQGIHQGIIEGDFALCISLYHGYELLLQMGIRSLFIYLWGIMDGAKGEMSFLPAPLLSHLARCMAERIWGWIWCFAPFIPLFGGAKGILTCPTSLQRFVPHQERAGA